MDITVVDVSQVDCAVGDRAYLLGEAISMTDFCEYYKVIPHEAMTMISKRIKRAYV
jgi:alanine racemase